MKGYAALHKPLNDPGVTELDGQTGKTSEMSAQTWSSGVRSAQYRATITQRILGAIVTVAIQALFLGGVLYGTHHSLVQIPPAPMMIDLITEAETQPDVPRPPPPKLVEIRPQNIPITETFEIMPEVMPQAPPAPNAITLAPPQPKRGDPSKAVETFQIKLLRHLVRHKRYPTSARTKKEQGVAYVRFTMDRSGHVLAAALERPSPHATLNQESLDLLRRADPLPAPPAEIEGSVIEMVVPVEFFLR